MTKPEVKQILGLIDYGMGNLHSVQKAFSRLNQTVRLVRKPSDIKNCSALILPGVGAFDPAMDHLTETGLIPHLKKWADDNRPLLGICLGLQLLFDSSDEGSQPGLGILKGHVHRLPKDQTERIPHMGWAKLSQKNNCPLLENEDKESWMYFVHSFEAIPSNTSEIAATVKFGINHELTAMVWHGRLGACQFHPEKSAKAGQRMLGKWISWLEKGAQT